MTVRRLISFLSSGLLAGFCGLLLFSCNGGGGGGLSGDIGDNDPDVVLAIGDSITNGGCVPDGAPYPARLAGLIKKKVINAGGCGETTGSGAAKVAGLLDKHNPGTLLVLYGANDEILGDEIEGSLARMRIIISAAKARKTRIAIGTVMPMVRDHLPFEGFVEAYNVQLKALAKKENVKVVDLFGEFSKRRDVLLQEDGLHPTDAGTQIIAAAFADVF
jgi:lysophospholipase L1-like esterase